MPHLQSRPSFRSRKTKVSLDQIASIKNVAQIFKYFCLTAICRFRRFPRYIIVFHIPSSPLAVENFAGRCQNVESCSCSHCCAAGIDVVLFVYGRVLLWTNLLYLNSMIYLIMCVVFFVSVSQTVFEFYLVMRVVCFVCITLQ